MTLQSEKKLEKVFKFSMKKREDFILRVFFSDYYI